MSTPSTRSVLSFAIQLHYIRSMIWNNVLLHAHLITSQAVSTVTQHVLPWHINPTSSVTPVRYNALLVTDSIISNVTSARQEVISRTLSVHHTVTTLQSTWMTSPTRALMLAPLTQPSSYSESNHKRGVLSTHALRRPSTSKGTIPASPNAQQQPTLTTLQVFISARIATPIVPHAQVPYKLTAQLAIPHSSYSRLSVLTPALTPSLSTRTQWTINANQPVRLIRLNIKQASNVYRSALQVTSHFSWTVLMPALLVRLSIIRHVWLVTPNARSALAPWKLSVHLAPQGSSSTIPRATWHAHLKKSTKKLQLATA
jgi:hypothetical protein